MRPARQYLWRNQRDRETATIRAFGDQSPEKFVLSATIAPVIRAFDDRDSCFWRPKFVFSATDQPICWRLDSRRGKARSSGVREERAGSNPDARSARVSTRAALRRYSRDVNQVEPEAGNGVVIGYSFQLIPKMLERALIAELQPKLLKINVDRAFRACRSRNLVKPTFDRPELEIAGRIVQHAPIALDRPIEPIAKPDLHGLQPLIAGPRLGVSELRFRQP